jgi:hypothetical protein
LPTIMWIYNAFTDMYDNYKRRWKTTSYISERYTESLQNMTWKYESETYTLVHQSAVPETKPNRIPWLCADLFFGDIKLGDISAWIVRLNYRSDGGNVPTTDVILQAWMADHSQTIVYSDLAGYRFVVIDELGEERTYMLGCSLAV